MASEDPIKDAAGYICGLIIAAGIAPENCVAYVDEDDLDAKLDRWVRQQSENVFVSVGVGDDWPNRSDVGPNAFDGSFFITVSRPKIYAKGADSITKLCGRVFKALNHKRRPGEISQMKVSVKRARFGTSEADVQGSKQMFSFVTVTATKLVNFE